MTSRISEKIQHRNSLESYLANARFIGQVLEGMPFPSTPRPLVSLGENAHDLSLMLSHLDRRLATLEDGNWQIDFQVYYEAKSFLKVCYLLARILFDDLAGVVKYLYDTNEPNSGLPKSFNALLKKARGNGLPEELSTVLTQAVVHFPEMKKRRDGLEHQYESILITFAAGKNDEVVLGHANIDGLTTKYYQDLRVYIGLILAEYQHLTDNLLDHFDSKFPMWYGVQPRRETTVYHGDAGIMLWWAHEYGGYRHKDLVVAESH